MPEATAGGLRLRLPVELRWADTDQYGHINNVAFVRYAEEARIRAFGLPDQPQSADPRREPPVLAQLGTDTFTITGGQRIEYVRELPYRGQSVLTEVWLSRIGSRSLDMDCRIVDEDDVEYAIVTVGLVIMDVASRRPRPLTEDETSRLRRYLGPGVTFR